MQLEEIVISNLKEVSHLIKEVAECQWEEWGIKEKDTLESIHYRVQHCMSETDIAQTFVATIHNEFVGTVSLWRNDLCARQDLYPWMACLYVREQYRHLGIGTCLQNKVIEVAKNMGYQQIFLITNHENLYEKNGWEFIEEAPLKDGKMTRIYTHSLL